MFVLIMVLSGVMSLIIPPAKSPDEADHVRRAYFLSQGAWSLHTQGCSPDGAWCRHGQSMSGGELDAGLHEFLIRYDAVGHPKESALDEALGNSIGWRGEKVFVAAPGTGFYFPLIYLPQAVGLGVGKVLGLSVAQSYYLARAGAVLAGALVLVLAFAIYLPPPGVLALLLLPMSLFQMASASIDFLSTALAMLAICCFVRASHQRTSADNGLFWIMAVSIFMVATCRTHLAAMVLLLFVAAWQSRRAWVWWLAAGTTVLILLWTVTAIPATVDFRTGREASAGEVALYYASNPAELLRVFWRTWTDKGLLDFYRMSFLGTFADRRLTVSAYAWLAGFVVLAALLSLMPRPSWRVFWQARLALVFAGLAAMVLAFLAMLVAWSPLPAQTILGVQGRYLLVPFILLLVGLGRWEPASRQTERMRNGFVLAGGCYALLVSVKALLAFFYTPLVTVVPVAAAGQTQGPLRPSAVIVPDRPLVLKFPERIPEEQKTVHWIGMMTATYARQLGGELDMVLTDEDGRQAHASVSLAGAKDNDYLFAPVPVGRWKLVELRVRSGNGGLSVWLPEVKGGASEEGGDGKESAPVGCMVTVGQGNVVVYTPGCPPPG